MALQDPSDDLRPPAGGVNPGYAAFQLSKALSTFQDHSDPDTRERAQLKVQKWEDVLRQMLLGTAEYGSRTPLESVPAWATLEVVTGGFATGKLLAEGPLQEHELALLTELPSAEAGGERRALNAHYLSEQGLADLSQRLNSGCYDVAVPEEGALLVVAWLAEQGLAEAARALLDAIAPFFARLRFYPIPLSQPRRTSSLVHVQDVKRTILDLRARQPNRRILAQKEAVEVWAPFLDHMVALLLETFDGERPCRAFPADWPDRAKTLLAQYEKLRSEYTLCGKPERAEGHFAKLRGYLAKAARDPQSLTTSDSGHVGLIIGRYVRKRGRPESEICARARQRQRADVREPTHHEVGQVVISRLGRHVGDEALDDANQMQRPIDADESRRFRLPQGSAVPSSIRQKVERCLNLTVAELVERGLVTSGEALARVLPQMTAGLRAANIADPALRRLYAAVYRAFRRRRSLLLLNLEKQVQMEELPWVAAVEGFRSADLSDKELAAQALEEITALTISSFPHAILPNKLLQELRALATAAGLEIPLVDEVAADIFMGQFSDKFVAAAKQAADLLDGTLYAAYYNIDFDAVRKISLAASSPSRRKAGKRAVQNGFAELCSARAGVPLGTWKAAANGMIIEQQQILTTQNLAALMVALDLASNFRDSLVELAQRCLAWVCRRQQMKIDMHHARLVMLKNTAYAWRQMVFYLALVPQSNVEAFLEFANHHLDAQSPAFAARFRPALLGLALASRGESLDRESAKRLGARRFLGWSQVPHWLQSGG